ncbi:MAG: GNAT family N-acetyltransferase [Oscillospiraceae bacterium]|nr:GNAT family N-acetyltransferase [Oscillospiraceae bacterium]
MQETLKAAFDIISISDTSLNTRLKEVEQLVASTWGSFKIAIHRELYDLRELPGFVAVNGEQKIIGYCYYRWHDDECEIMVLESLQQGIGVGGALVEAVIGLARTENCARVHLRTSNDNTNAFRFYQRRGFTMCAVGWNDLDYARALKPEIPLIGEDEIPLMHEIEFEMKLSAGEKNPGE